MANEKTSIWIGRLSDEGKTTFRSFMFYFNTGELDTIKCKLEDGDLETLTTIIHRLKLQNSVEKINKAIKDFNEAKGFEISQIKE